MYRNWLSVLHLLALFFWPTVTWAASVTLSKSLQGVDLGDWLAVFILSAFSGGIALLNRIRNENHKYREELAEFYAEERKVRPVHPNWWLTGIAHMGVAVLAGGAMFLACESADVGDFREALYIAAAAWAGSKLLDVAVNGGMGALQGFFNGAGKQT